MGSALEIRADLPAAFMDGTPMPAWRSVEIYLLQIPSQPDKLPATPPPTSFYVRKNILEILPREQAQAKIVGGRLLLSFALKDLRIPEDKSLAVFWGFVVVGPKGQRGMPSEILPFMVLPPLPPVGGLTGTSEPQGVKLTFAPPENAEKIRVARAVESGLPTTLGDLPRGSASYVDTQARSSAFYTYLVTAVGKDEGHVSPSARVDITYKDTFPPTPPDSVVYLPMEGKAWLKFAPGEGAAKYRISRHCPGEEPVLVMETTDTLASVEASYCDYGVASIDEAGNTSAVIMARKEQP